MRNLFVVIDEIIKLIPDDHTEDVLISRLRSIQNSFNYTSPELIGLSWQRTAEVLMDSFGIKEELFSDWQKRIINLWMNDKVFDE